ncbi:hypothetical protein LTR85_007217 [Meristemomyces frigidus]|nr:hypothetical protein LTR85_007217 [Meristemomyces frigidus]
MPSFYDIGRNAVESVVKSILGVEAQQQQGTSPTNTSVRLPKNLNSRSVGQQRAYMEYQTPNFTSARSHITSEDNEIDEDALAPAVRPTPKRRREADGEEALVAARKRIHKSDHERRLTGDYRVPTNAIPIGVPTYSGDSQAEDESSRRAGTKMGSFRPMNTLNSSPHASKGSMKSTPRQLPTDFYQGHKRAGDGPGQGRLNTTKSVGANVAAKGIASQNGDGFPDSGRSAKRQKLTHSKMMPGIESDPVDLTDQDDPVADDGVRVVISVPAKPANRPAVASQGRSHPRSARSKGTDAFGGESQIKKLDQMLVGRPRTARKPMNAGRSSQASQTPSIVEVESNGHTFNGTGARNAPVDLERDSENPQRSATSSAIRRTIDQSGTRPPIELTKGWNEEKTTRSKRGDASDRQRTDDILNAALERNRRGLRSDGVDLAPTRTLPHPTAGPSDGSFPSYLPTGSRGHDEQRTRSPNLRQTFKRDISEGQRPPQRAKERMLETSYKPSRKVNPIDDSLGSLDELQGGNTVSSKVPRSASPQKKSRSADQQARGSPSDIKHTISKEFRRPRQRDDNDSDEPRGRRTEEPPDSSIMPIKAFYAASGVETGGNLSLRYNARGDALDLFDGDHPVIVPGKRRSVSIGTAEANKVFHSHGCNRVHITGSATDVSNGRVCIAFNDHEGVEWFTHAIMEVTNSQATKMHLTPDKMNATFARQSHDIQQAAHQWQARAHKAALAMTGYTGRQTSGEEDEDEEIRYESNTPEPPKLRKKMLGGNDEDLKISQHPARSERQPESSPYFLPAGMLRRTTRQTKPVKERVPSPSPERWSRVHNPKPWLHSVVYPPSGARRVTVEYGDLERLDEGQFLNDNLVSFALRRIEEDMAPEHKDSVHFFNSFFYPSFTTKNGKKVFNYDAVKRWTKNKDIFSVPYIVVPICIDLHWFVAIICNLPNLSRKLAAADEEYEPPQEVTVLPDPEEAEEIEGSTEVVDADAQEGPTRDETAAMHKLSLSDTGKGAAETEVSEAGEVGLPERDAGADDTNQKTSGTNSRTSTGSSKRSKKKGAPPARKFDPDMPAIVTLDSFGNTHGAEVRNLKDYLKAEAGAKRGMDLDREMLQGVTAKGIPEQTNFCDCGVYLIGYVEQFAANPRQFVTKALSKELDQQADFASFNPSAKRAEIREELLRLNVELEEAHRAKKKQKKAQVEVAAQATDKELDNKASEPAPAPALPEQETAQTTAAPATMEEPARNSPVARPEAHVVAPIWEPGSPAKNATPTENDDDAEELDMAPARPLQLPVMATEAHHGTLRQEDSSDEESSEEESEEMLDDNPGDAGGNAVDAPAPQAAPEDLPLLDGLDQALGHGTAMPADDGVSAPEAHGSADADADEAGNTAEAYVDDKNHISRSEAPQHESHDTEPLRQTPAEVPDSQEARSATHSQVRQGNYIRFLD